MPQTATLLSVQILRALAAAMVMIGHAAYEAETIAGKLGQALPQLRFVDWAFGVDVFFVISGFIMLHTSDGFGGLAGPKRFLMRRLIRVVPLYWLMTSALLIGAFAVPGMLNTPVDGWRMALASYLFIPFATQAGDVHPVLGLGWTLNYEMFFYAFFALSMLAPLRWAAAAMACSFTVFVWAGMHFQFGSVQLRFWTNPIILEFLFGAGLGLALKAGLRLGAFAAPALALAGCLGAVALGPAFGLAQDLPPLLRNGVPAAMIVAGAVLGPALPASRFVLVLAALGDASYSLYLTHPFSIRPLRNLWLGLAGPQVPLVIYLLAACAAAVTGALLVYHLVERPMTLALQRRFRP